MSTPRGPRLPFCPFAAGTDNDSARRRTERSNSVERAEAITGEGEREEEGEGEGEAERRAREGQRGGGRREFDLEQTHNPLYFVIMF